MKALSKRIGGDEVPDIIKTLVQDKEIDINQVFDTKFGGRKNKNSFYTFEGWVCSRIGNRTKLYSTNIRNIEYFRRVRKYCNYRIFVG